MSALAVFRDWMQWDKASWDNPSNVSFYEVKNNSKKIVLNYLFEEA